jgi:hypothetical protein
METTQRECPMCEQLMTEQEGSYFCSEHGCWHTYGAKLLVRAPSETAKQPERVAMPWEFRIPVLV